MKWFGAGALCLGLCFLAREGEGAGEASEKPAVWVADRARGRVFGLSESLLPVVELPLPSPERLLRASDGFLWCLSRDDEGAAELLRIDLGLATVGEADSLESHGAFDEVLDLAVLGDGSALVLEADALWRVGGGRRRRLLLRMPGARGLAARGETVLVAGTDGRLVLVDCDPQPVLVALRRSEGEIVDVAPAWGGGWWVLEGSRAPLTQDRLARLEADGRLRWSRSVGVQAQRLAPARGGVWLADGAGASLLHYGPRGELARRVELPAAWAAPALVCVLSQGLLLTTSGALAALSSDGRWVGTQGGFADLVDLVPGERLALD